MTNLTELGKDPILSLLIDASSASRRFEGRFVHLCLPVLRVSTAALEELSSIPLLRTNLAGFPAWISKLGISFVTTLPATTTAHSPIVTPGQRTDFAPTHEPSPRTIGLTTKPKAVSDQS